MRRRKLRAGAPGGLVLLTARSWRLLDRRPGLVNSLSAASTTSSIAPSGFTGNISLGAEFSQLIMREAPSRYDTIKTVAHKPLVYRKLKRLWGSRPGCTCGGTATARPHAGKLCHYNLFWPIARLSSFRRQSACRNLGSESMTLASPSPRQELATGESAGFVRAGNYEANLKLVPERPQLLRGGGVDKQ